MELRAERASSVPCLSLTLDQTCKLLWLPQPETTLSGQRAIRRAEPLQHMWLAATYPLLVPLPSCRGSSPFNRVVIRTREFLPGSRILREAQPLILRISAGHSPVP